MNIEEFLTLAAKEEASDLFIVAGLPLTMKVNGVMHRINEEKMMPQDTEKMIREIYEKALGRHGTEFIHLKRFISKSDTFLCKNDRSRRTLLHKDCNNKHDR